MTHSVRACALLGTLALAVAAHAQESKEPYNFAIQGGVGGFRASAVRDLMGKSNTYIGVRKFASGFDAQISPDRGVPSFDVDYLHGGKDGSSATGYGVGVVERVPLTDSGKKGVAPYFGFGMGIGRSNIKQKVRIQNGTEVAFKTNTATKTGIYYKAMVGLDLGSKAFLEFGYIGFPTALSMKPSSVVTSVGVRF